MDYTLWGVILFAGAILMIIALLTEQSIHKVIKCQYCKRELHAGCMHDCDNPDFDKIKLGGFITPPDMINDHNQEMQYQKIQGELWVMRQKEINNITLGVKDGFITNMDDFQAKTNEIIEKYKALGLNN